MDELGQARAVVIKAARDINDKAHAEKRALTAEEQAGYDKAMAEGERLRKQAIEEKRLADAEAELAAVTDANQRNIDAGNAGGGGGAGGGGNQAAVLRPDEVRGAPLFGRAELGQFYQDETHAHATATRAYAAAFNSFLSGRPLILTADTPAEVRALSADVSAEGGYLIAPEQFMATLIKALDAKLFIRARGTGAQVRGAHQLGKPSLDADPADCEWTTELSTGTPDATMAFGKREFVTEPARKLIKVSKTLLRKSPLGVENIVMDRLTYKLGVTQEKAYMTGSGTGQPLGLFTASADGIPTGRDIDVSSGSQVYDFDLVMAAKYKLRSAYWPTAEWIWHADEALRVMQLKDLDGPYLWRESVRAGEPERMLGHPVNFSEHAPNTHTTGEYVCIFGDLSYYHYVDELNASVQALRELYAATNQDGFIISYEGDGMPVLGEAFVRGALN